VVTAAFRTFGATSEISLNRNSAPSDASHGSFSLKCIGSSQRYKKCMATLPLLNVE
jgi:hypothetical protein